MSSSRSHHRRILRGGDGAAAPTAAILVQAPGTGPGPGGSSVAEMIERAREEGYRAAVEEMSAAEAAGRAAQLRRVADALVQAARDVAEARREAVAVAAEEAAGLAHDLAAAFLQRELALGRPALDAVARALALAPEGHDLVVRINPNDPVSVDDLDGLVTDGDVKVVCDPRVEAGGCVIQAGPARIDTQLGAAMQRVREVLAEVYPDAAPALGLIGEEEVA
ncbi:MAG TPA: FliH/SctL family protein [Acidimicrobiales bacterium]|nr:FliH/SctL family protein [Acidimicrobiales bacterium]